MSVKLNCISKGEVNRNELDTYIRSQITYNWITIIQINL